MSFTNRPHRSESTAAPRRRSWRTHSIPWMVAVVLLVPGFPRVTEAQTVLPAQPPTQVFSEDFSTGIDPSVWTVWPTGSGAWSSSNGSIWCYASGHWNTHLEETGATSSAPSGLLIAKSMPGNPGYNPVDWTNIRMEFDIYSSNVGQMGFTWGLQPDSNDDGYPDAGYLFYIDSFADAKTPPGPSNRAQWYLLRRENDINTVVGSGQVVLVEGDNDLDSMYAWHCYRLRLDWFCGNLRVQVRKETFGSTWCQTGCYGGCGYDGADPETAWCTIIEWTEPNPVLTPGGAGFWHGSPEEYWVGQGDWDNLEISSWGPDCSICSDWTEWNTSWPTGSETATDTIPFKLLFDSVLADGTLLALDGQYKGRNDLCGPWQLLADLPDPTQQAGSNSDRIKAYLERVATSKTASDMFNFSDNFDADNPVPLMYWGQTPIKQTLQSAYDWYKTTRGPGGSWSDAADPLSHCRNWYVIFITDGEESCDMVDPGDTPAVCQWLASSESFQNPGAGLEPVPILTIGFSANVDSSSPLKCMSTQTGGQFYTANNATELAAAIANVINLMSEENRSFLPLTVSPDPTSLGSSFSNEFLLTLPIFVPRNGSSVWDGHYYAFRLNPSNPTPPMKDVLDQDGNVIGRVIDTDQAVWDAADEVATQTTSNNRKIFYSRDSGGQWKSRTVFPSIKTDGTLLAEFKSWTGVSLDANATEIVDFVDGVASGRSSPLGDIFHSKPALVGPPNNFRYYYSNVHDYFTDFMSVHKHRRRVAFVGSNDGLFHAFDAGFYDRDETNWNDRFDLGNGVELFGYVPHAVIDPPTKPSSLKTMTFGTEQVYSVDGSVASADVYIDPTGGTNREWRTVVLFGLRRGGRGVTALDVTQPDPISGGEPQLSVLPGCLDNGPGCDGEYPKPLWEFTVDQDTDADADGEKDLGLTWSTPVVARVKKQGGGGTTDDVYIAFFGGGMPVRPGDPTDHTGRFFYGLDVATGEIVYKANIGAAVPGGLATLDQDDDGFVDRIYFGDTAGGLWRLDVTGPVTDSGGGNLDTSSWTLTKIYEFDSLEIVDSGGNSVGQAPAEFFMTPKLVPVSFAGGTFTWGIAIGSGDRAQVGKLDGVRNRFYFVMDVDDTLRGETDLQQVDYDAANADADANFFNPSGGTYGWYLRLRPNEKVTTAPIIVAEKVFFGTFEATDPGADQGVCHAGGLGRLYFVYYNNVNPVEDSRGEEFGSGMIVGTSSYTLGGTTYALANTPDLDIENKKMVHQPTHRVSNWRQE